MSQFYWSYRFHSPIRQTPNVPGVKTAQLVGYWLDTRDRAIEVKRPNMEVGVFNILEPPVRHKDRLMG